MHPAIVGQQRNDLASSDDKPTPALAENEGKPTPALAENEGKPTPALAENEGKPTPALAENEGKPTPALAENEGKPTPAMGGGGFGFTVTKNYPAPTDVTITSRPKRENPQHRDVSTRGLEPESEPAKVSR